MAIYFWDLGFDFATVQRSNTLSFLQNGFVLAGLPAIPKNIKLGDTVNFNVFNLTAGATLGDGTNILLASLHFTNAVVGQSAVSPFNDSIVQAALGTATTAANSFIFGATTNFPRWTISSQIMTNQGNFLFTAALIVQMKSGVRAFVVDPEMIVG